MRAMSARAFQKPTTSSIESGSANQIRPGTGGAKRVPFGCSFTPRKVAHRGVFRASCDR